MSISDNVPPAYGELSQWTGDVGDLASLYVGDTLRGRWRTGRGASSTAYAVAGGLRAFLASCLDTTAEVLGIYQRTVVLDPAGDGPLVTLAAPAAGLVPYGVTVSPAVVRYWADRADAVVRIGQYAIGPVALSPAETVDLLLPSRRMSAERLTALHAALMRQAPAQSLARDRTYTDAWLLAYSLAAAALEGDQRTVRNHVRSVAGLGPGLTPAGDDLLVGVMAATLTCGADSAGRCLAAELPAAAARTTRIAAHFLRSAAGGQFASRVHSIVASLDAAQSRPVRDEAERALNEALSWGATSGSDLLVGLIGAAACLLRLPPYKSTPKATS